MSFWKRTMDYLGLGPDAAYDDYDEPVEPEPQARGSRSATNDSRGRSRGGQAWPADPEDPTVRAAPARPSYPSRDFESPNRRAAQPTDDSGAHARTSRAPSPRVTMAQPPDEPITVRPRRFDQAQELADKFKENQPVILNLESTERDVARRLIDFASGVCYSLDGSMEKVATGVYLLKPSPQRVHRIDDYEG